MQLIEIKPGEFLNPDLVTFAKIEKISGDGEEKKYSVQIWMADSDQPYKLYPKDPIGFLNRISDAITTLAHHEKVWDGGDTIFKELLRDEDKS